ncbi:hypothetical protein BFW01_g7577 [Lasiodiplodia theobromae]|nr:hypothetical protein BFW01_g7577 [Lasiodiplodia theobromae]
MNEGSAEGTWDDVMDDSMNRDDSEERNSNPEDTARAQSPKLKAQQPTEDFINNRLAQVNPAFERHPIQYDPDSGSWVPKSKTEPLGDTSTTPFWNSIFGDAMARFNIEFPRRPHSKGYDIRCRTNWTEVSIELNAARQYRIEKSGIKAIPSMKHTSDMDSISPVLGVLKVLVGDVQAVIFGRDEITHEFHHLYKLVPEVELALLASPMTDEVKSMSIDLFVITFRGVEFAIEVFASNKGGKMETKHIIVKGGNYREKLHDILTDMTVCIAKLQKVVESPRELHSSFRVQVAETERGISDTLRSLIADQIAYLNQREAMYLNQPQMGYHAPKTSYFTSNGDLLDFIDIPNFRRGDMQQILEKRDFLDFEQRMQAENIVQSQQFKDWYFSTASKILLIHGDYAISKTDRVLGAY